jgi:hypothetical protein
MSASAIPAAYQARSGGLNVEPSANRAAVLCAESLAGSGVSWANSTAQQIAQLIEAAAAGRVRGATHNTKV